MRSLLLTIASILSLMLNAYSQNSDMVHSCGNNEELTKEERQALAEEFQAWSSRPASRINNSDAEIWTVPLVFHVLTTNSPSVAAFGNAVNKLNEAFANSGSFQSAEGVDSRIQFCLASTAPDGAATSGVNHIPSDYKNLDKELDKTELLKLSKWDDSKYINIWVVEEVMGEALAFYEGKRGWTRLPVGGFAFRDGIVATSIDPGLLAHEIGHYFGLLHTFAERNCVNNDCQLDGDMICDTPPDKSVSSCGDNSCGTDTLSNYSNQIFKTDVPDLSSNFMDYSPCSRDFTKGQVERMRFTLEKKFPALFFKGPGHPLCETPCGDDSAVQFYLDNQFPKAGETTRFTSQLTGNFNPIYTWFVSPLSGDWSKAEKLADQVSNMRNLEYTFSNEGLYRVTLQVVNADNPSCVASFSRNVDVKCGVNSRFTMDKRVIASKQPHGLFTDSIKFTNLSSNALSYEWVIEHQNFNPQYENLPEFRSAITNLAHFFKEPGTYKISLVAKNGNCEETSEPFFLDVHDPTMDGVPLALQIGCNDRNSFQVVFSLYNYGYDTINVNTPIAFYNGDPRQSADVQLLGVWRSPNAVYGLDNEYFSTALPGDIREFQELFMVFNDTGSVASPVSFPPGDLNQLSNRTVFPPSGLAELSYTNNYNSFLLIPENFPPVGLELKADPPSCPGNNDGQISIIPDASNGTFSYVWHHDPTLTGNTASGLAPGTYTVTVTDEIGCGYSVVSYELVDPEPLGFSGVAEIIPTSCPNGIDGKVILKLNGGTGNLSVDDYPFTWQGETLAVSGISKGPFSFLIQDENGCAIPFEGEMTSPDPLQINFIQKRPSCPGSTDGELIAEVSGGTAPYTYLWEDGSTGPVLGPLPAGAYPIEVRDANNCSLFSTGIVPKGILQVRMPSGYNPQEGFYYPISSCEISYELMIWNRWGQMVYAGSSGWDGTFTGEDAILGGYTYRLNYNYSQNGIIQNDELRGSFFLVR